MRSLLVQPGRAPHRPAGSLADRGSSFCARFSLRSFRGWRWSRQSVLDIRIGAVCCQRLIEMIGHPTYQRRRSGPCGYSISSPVWTVGRIGPVGANQQSPVGGSCSFSGFVEVRMTASTGASKPVSSLSQADQRTAGPGLAASERRLDRLRRPSSRSNDHGLHGRLPTCILGLSAIPSDLENNARDRRWYPPSPFAAPASIFHGGGHGRSRGERGAIEHYRLAVDNHHPGPCIRPAALPGLKCAQMLEGDQTPRAECLAMVASRRW